MAIATDAKGNEFLAFAKVRESDIDGVKLDAPLTHALIVARRCGRILLMFNRYRSCWELPGGVIDDGETLRQCAVRELLEETSQVAVSMVFRGIMKFHLQPGFRSPERTEYGALYSAHIQEVFAFVANDESEKITWWDGNSDIGYINEIDKKLTEFA